MIFKYTTKISEYIEYCPYHIGVGWPAYHVDYKDNVDKKIRIFQCSRCVKIFEEGQGQEVDSR